MLGGLEEQTLKAWGQPQDNKGITTINRHPNVSHSLYQRPDSSHKSHRRLKQSPEDYGLYFVHHHFIPAHTVKGRVLNLYKMLGSFSSGNILPRLF